MRAFPGGSAVKNLPEMQKRQETSLVGYLAQEDTLRRAWKRRKNVRKRREGEKKVAREVWGGEGKGGAGVSGQRSGSHSPIQFDLLG